MSLTRKEFIKKACLTGAGFCGFNAWAGLGEERRQASGGEDEAALERKYFQDWISTLLLNVDKNADPEECRRMLKPCSEAHYAFLKMDDMLSPYAGNIDKFLKFIGEKWGWKIKYDPASGVIVADENKSYCACPLVDKEKGVRSSILCYCSEGFAEKMFSKVVGHPVKARVVSSIYRGNDRCVYEIRLKA